MELPVRKNIRLKNYNYAWGGAYFITICCHDKRCLFGSIGDGKMLQNKFGEIVAEEWIRSAEIRKEIELDEFVVMPNHFHGMVRIVYSSAGDPPVYPSQTSCVGTPVAPTLSKTIGALIAGFKQSVTIRMRKLGFDSEVWQRGFYDHVIRNQEDYDACSEYIITNPQNWEMDKHR